MTGRLTLVLALLVGGEIAADPARLAQEAADTLAQAGQLMEADPAKGLDAAIAAYETGMAALREAERQARTEADRIAAARRSEARDLAASVRILSRLTRAPRETLALHPAGPLAAARAGRLAAAALDQSVVRTARLVRLSKIVAADAALRQALRDSLTQAQAEARAARRSLINGARKAGSELPVTDAAILAALVEAADGLDGLAEVLGAEMGTLSNSETLLSLPVSGPARAEGDTIAMAPAPGAVLVAPSRATVRYAGPAPGSPEAQSLFLEPAPGQLMILWGAFDPLAKSGQIVSAGDPIGVMRLDRAGDRASDDPNVNEGDLGAGQHPPERLYIAWRDGKTRGKAAAHFEMPQ